MTPLGIMKLATVAAALVAPALAAAQRAEPPAAPASEGERAAPEHRPLHAVEDLTLLNFFTKGWDEDWVHRHRRTRDMALLRVTTNFLERELRLDFTRTNPNANPRLTASDFGNVLVAYAPNRRLMLEVIANYQWNEIPRSTPAHGAGGGFLLRFQVVDTEVHSLSFQARVSPANKGIGQTQTSLQYTVAGWQDLQALIPVLDRVGLYYSFQLENLPGSHKVGARENDLSYALSLAKTWTRASTPVLADLTTFLEALATTDLDGNGSGKTVLSLTPGVRFWVLPKHSLTLGVDLPVSHGASFSSVYRATYIFNF